MNILKNINKYNNFIIKIIDNNIKNNNITNINTRFAPDPNGYLHIGHVKTILINFIIAKKYNGYFNLRFDDTNPINNNSNYIKSIKNDMLWLGFKWDNENYTSNYFEEIYKFAIKLIKKKLAYVDELSLKDFKLYRGNIFKQGVNSPYRNRSIYENIKCFDKMKNGLYNENTACLRAKINMKDKNIINRDPVLYRIRFCKHFRTYNKWCIYPTYDFSHCISDYIEKITYSLCTLEFLNNRLLYNWILNSLNINKKPIQYEFSKLKIENFILSKRKLNKIFIKYNIKYNHPILPTISGLKNRGLISNSIINFCKNLSISKKESSIKIKYFEKFLKYDLNINSIKIMSVINPIILEIFNLDNNYFEFINISDNLKNKKIFFSKILYVEKFDFYNINNKLNNIIGKFIKLKYSYIIKIINFKFDIYLNLTKIYCIYFKNTLNSIFLNNKKVYKIIHWVSYKENYKSYFKIYNNILNLSTNDILNKNNKDIYFIKKGFTEKSSIVLIKNMKYKCERLGYFLIKNFNKKKIIFNEILILNNKFI